MVNGGEMEGTLTKLTRLNNPIKVIFRSGIACACLAVGLIAVNIVALCVATFASPLFNVWGFVAAPPTFVMSYMCVMGGREPTCEKPNWFWWAKVTTAACVVFHLPLAVTELTILLIHIKTDPNTAACALAAACLSQALLCLESINLSAVRNFKQRTHSILHHYAEMQLQISTISQVAAGMQNPNFDERGSEKNTKPDGDNADEAPQNNNPATSPSPSASATASASEP